MKADEARALIKSNIDVTPFMVSLARVQIVDGLDRTETESTKHIGKVLAANGALKPERVHLHESFDTQAECEATAKYLSWSLAAVEAIWSLIARNVLLASSENRANIGSLFHVANSTAGPDGSGTNSGWSEFEKLAISVPYRVVLAPSLATQSRQQLSDPDVYISTLAGLPIDDEVVDALKETILCYRAEFYAASIALLEKASEGAWIELARALLKYAGADAEGISHQRNVLENHMSGIAKKIEATREGLNKSSSVHRARL